MLSLRDEGKKSDTNKTRIIRLLHTYLYIY